MSDYHNIVLILPSVISNDYFWHGSKFAYDTRHHDWSRGVLFSPWLVISHRRLLLARDYFWTVTPVCSDLNYEPFKYIENNNYFMCDIHNKISVDSLYYTESEFKEHFEFKQKGSSNFSLVHFNCRSMASNFDKLIDSVKALDFPFDVIAVSESWLNTTTLVHHTP